MYYVGESQRKANKRLIKHIKNFVFNNDFNNDLDKARGNLDTQSEISFHLIFSCHNIWEEILEIYIFDIWNIFLIKNIDVTSVRR